MFFAAAVSVQADNDPSAVIHLTDGNTVTYNLADIDNLKFVAAEELQVSTIAGNGKAAVAEGKGLAAGVRSPQGLAFAPDGNLWICSQNGHVLLRMTPDCEVTKIATTNATFNAPWGCAFDKSGNCIVASKGNHMVFSVAPDGTASQILTAADWKGPMGVTVDKDGFIYVADRDNKAIRKIGNDGTVVQSFEMSDCKQGPCGVAVDGKGNVYAVNGADYKAFMFTPDGTRSVLFGNGTKPTADTWTDGEAGDIQSASMGQSFSITIAADGTMYIGDLLAFVVRAITPDANGDYTAGTIRTIAGVPFTKGKADGPAAEATFNQLGTVIEHGGDIYVADNVNNLIRLISKE